jgi:serine/threonine-protein kinase
MRSYEEIFELGRGGMGVVHLACGRGAGGFENLVVVKRLHAHLMDDEKSIKRFLNEARVAALIHHANVVGTQYVGEDENGYFLVLDYVEGLSLDDLFERAKAWGRPMPLPVVLRVALDALAGLSAVHEATDPGGRPLHLLHRDISPHNLLVGRDGVTRIADFGVARSDQQQTTERKYLIGKLCFISREYLRREELWANSDVYALAVSLWLVLIGHEPWPLADEIQLLRHIADDRLPPLSSEREVSPVVDALLLRGTEPDRTARFQSAREMADAIEDAAAAGERVASAREVADFVNELAGREFDERSGRVAAWFAKGGSTRPAAAAPERRASQEPTRQIQPSAGRPPLVRAVIAAVLILAAAGALTALSMRERASQQLRPALASAPITRDVVPEAASAPPAATIAAALPSASEQSVRPAPATRAPAGSPARVPSKITTKNPYR